jgi:hypothetical protein
MAEKPERYDEFISLIGSEETRPKVSEKELLEVTERWKGSGIDNSSKIIGYPSEIPVLIGHLVDDKKFTDEGWRECWGYARENADVFELDLWIYRTGEGDTLAETETVVLKELIQELNECISTIIGMWKGLERNHRKTIHSGIERLQEAQAKFVELGSDL